MPGRNQKKICGGTKKDKKERKICEVTIYDPHSWSLRVQIRNNLDEWKNDSTWNWIRNPKSLCKYCLSMVLGAATHTNLNCLGVKVKEEVWKMDWKRSIKRANSAWVTIWPKIVMP